MTRRPELLAPAGTMEKLEAALRYGADAAYLGGRQFGLRAFGGNFTQDEIAAAVRLAHGMGKKIYVTVNVFPHNEDLVSLPDYLCFLKEAGADAVLVADLGVFMCAREATPGLPIHVSTQANNVNWRTVRAWQELGATRVVLARELSAAEIQEIRRATDVELELFVHGAMCISYSGRCLLSSYFTGRDANRGSCAQSCRWKYALVEESRPGEYYPIAEDERGTYIMNSKDLCLLPYLDEVIACGVDSLKAFSSERRRRRIRSMDLRPMSRPRSSSGWCVPMMLRRGWQRWSSAITCASDRRLRSFSRRGCPFAKFSMPCGMRRGRRSTPHRTRSRSCGYGWCTQQSHTASCAAMYQ